MNLRPAFAKMQTQITDIKAIWRPRVPYLDPHFIDLSLSLRTLAVMKHFQLDGPSA